MAFVVVDDGWNDHVLQLLLAVSDSLIQGRSIHHGNGDTDYSQPKDVYGPHHVNLSILARNAGLNAKM